MRLEEGWRPTTLEAVLGPDRGRYFGEGYRGVRHELQPISDPPLGADVGWLAQVAYPTGWSQDQDGKSRQPHLSTIDAVVLPLMALSSMRRHDSAGTRYDRTYVSRIELRAASKPWFDLDAVPVSLYAEGSQALASGRVQEQFRATTGNLRALIALAGEMNNPPRQVQPHSADAAAEYGVYDHLYHFTQASSSLTAYEPELGRLTSAHYFEHNSRLGRSVIGVEGEFWPALSVVDYLVTFGQLSQALIHLRHGVGRAGALWMRRMTIKCESKPEALPTKLESSMTIERDDLIDRYDRRFRNIVVDARTSNGIHVEAHLAHEDAR